MKSKLIPRLALATGCLLALPSLLRGQTPTGKVTLRISGIHSGKGRLEVRLWKSKDGFPKDDTKAVRRISLEIVNGTATTAFSDLPTGIYAVSAFHDENGNGKMDTRFPGIPVKALASRTIRISALVHLPSTLANSRSVPQRL